MNRVIKCLQYYILIGTPFSIGFMAWLTFKMKGEANEIEYIHDWLQSVLLCNFLAWVISLLLLTLIMVISPSAREQTLRGIAGIKDRDEREQIVTGKAARFSYVATLSLIAFFIVLSMLQVSYEKTDPTKTPDGSAHMLRVGLRLNFLDPAAPEKGSSGNIILKSSDIPISKTGILFLILIWQIGSFSLNARREMHLEE